MSSTAPMVTSGGVLLKMSKTPLARSVPSNASTSAGVSNTFSLDFQIHMIVMAIIGGRFSMFGSLFGAYFVILLEEILRGMVTGPIENLIIYSIGFCVYFFSPEGLFPKIASLKKRLIG